MRNEAFLSQSMQTKKLGYPNWDYLLKEIIILIHGLLVNIFF